MSRYHWNKTTHQKELVAGAYAKDDALSTSSNNSIQNNVITTALYDVEESIAPREDEATISQTYQIGEQFYHGNDLCRAKTQITQGTAWTNLVLNTNYELADQVTSQIQALANNKLDKTGGTLTGNIVVQKSSGTSGVTATKLDSTNGNSTAMIWADTEGGNIRLTKNNDPFVEIDTNGMNGSNGYARLYTGKTDGTGGYKFFKFKEDGDFEDGKGNSFQSVTAPILNVLGAKNMFAGQFASTEFHGVAYSVDSNTGIVTVTGTVTTGQSYSLINSSKFILPKGTYILSGAASTAGSYMDICSSASIVATHGSEVTFTLDADTSVYLRIVIVSGDGTVNLTYKPMVRPINTVDNTYVPYVPTNKELATMTSFIKALGANSNNKATLTCSGYSSILFTWYQYNVGVGACMIFIENHTVYVADFVDTNTTNNFTFSHSGQTLTITGNNYWKGNMLFTSTGD